MGSTRVGIWPRVDTIIQFIGRIYGVIIYKWSTIRNHTSLFTQHYVQHIISRNRKSKIRRTFNWPYFIDRNLVRGRRTPFFTRRLVPSNTLYIMVEFCFDFTIIY
jgi:hypothetical protein